MDLYWTIWIQLVILSFAIYEAVQIMSGQRKRTLTAWIRTFLGIEQKRSTAVFAGIMFTLGMLAFTIWFIPHIVWGWWGGK